MVTIQNLEVQFDVQGTDDEKMLKQMFNQCIEEWSRQRDDQRRQRKAMHTDRQLGDRAQSPDQGY